MAAQTFSNFSSDSQTYIAQKMLLRAQRNVIVYGLGKKEKLPNRFSKTFQYTRYDKLNLPQSPLSEGVTPSSASLSLQTVSAVMDQWGSYVELSDVTDVTLKHPVMQEAIDLLADQAAELIDRECIKVLLANTNVFYPGAIANRVSLLTTSYIDTPTIKKALVNLREGGAYGYDGRLFRGVIDPAVEMDLAGESTFVNAASYSNIKPLENGEVGQWMGVRWVCSNFIPTVSRLSDATNLAAENNANGALAASTTYYFKCVAVKDSTGFDVAATQVQSQATGAGDDAILFDVPTLAGHTFKIYIGTSAVNLKLYASGVASGTTGYRILSVPSSGEAPIAHPNTGVEVHFSWILGKESFAVPELMSLQTFLTPKTPSDSDPLSQRRKAGWKVMFKCVIQNESFLARLETASAY